MINWNDFVEEISLVNRTKVENNFIEKNKFPIKILRNEKIIEESVMLTHNSETSTYVLGVQLEQQKMNFLEKVDFSFVIFFEKFNVTLDSIYGSILQELIEKDLIVNWRKNEIIQK